MKITPLSLEATRYALNLPDLTNPEDGKHAMQLLMNNIVTALTKHWKNQSKIYRESPIISIADNYDKIGYPPDGASRDSRYTRYVCDTALLRTMTSAMIPRAIQSVKDNLPSDLLLACPGICYRRDSIDKLHTGEPHQLDLWRLSESENMTVDHLKEMIRIVVEEIMPGHEWKIEEKIHPYTLNGYEIDVLSKGEWIEIGECGLADPKIIKQNLDRDDVTGLAMGLGLDRILMIIKEIPDIRLFRSKDPRISAQMQDLSKYKEVSMMPAVVRDLSIVIDKNSDAEELGDKVREALTDEAEIIEAVQILSETPYDQLPSQAIERLGIDNSQKNILLRVSLRALDRTLTNEECNVYRDRIYRLLHKGTVITLATK